MKTMFLKTPADLNLKTIKKIGKGKMITKLKKDVTIFAIQGASAAGAV